MGEGTSDTTQVVTEDKEFVYEFGGSSGNVNDKGNRSHVKELEVSVPNEWYTVTVEQSLRKGQGG